MSNNNHTITIINENMCIFYFGICSCNTDFDRLSFFLISLSEFI